MRPSNRPSDPLVVPVVYAVIAALVMLGELMVIVVCNVQKNKYKRLLMGYVNEKSEKLGV